MSDPAQSDTACRKAVARSSRAGLAILATRRPLVRLAVALALALGAISLVAPAHAGNRAPAIAEIVQAEIRTGWRGENGQRMAALHLHLADGWRTYWRIPGSAGIAPRFDWSRSQNLAGVRVHWPRPEIFDQDGYTSIGYGGELVLPLELTPRDPSRPIALRGELMIGLCRDICIPADLSVTGPLRGDGAHDPLIAAALQRGPEPASQAGLRHARCQIRPTERGAELTLRIGLPRLGGQEHVIIELPGAPYWVTSGPTRREGGELVTRATLRAPQGDPVSISRNQVAFTILAGDRMIDHQGCSGG